MSKEILGTMYFVPYVDGKGELRSRYEGEVVAFLVKKDDGSTFEVRKDSRVFPDTEKPIKRSEVKSIKVGERLAYLHDSTPSVTVQKVFQDEGHVWVRGDNGKQTVLKHYELKRVGG